MKIISMLFALWFTLCTLVSPGKNNPWLLTDFPAYDGGIKSATLYDAGSGREVDWLDESAENNHYVQGIYNTTTKELQAYLNKLEGEGFIRNYENHIEWNHFYSYTKGAQKLYISFSEKLGEVRVMDDAGSCEVADFGYTATGATEPAVFQFGFPYYDQDICTDDTIYSRNGMCYILRLSDNKLVIIDGGSIKQSSDKNVELFMNFLHEITGTKEDEKIQVAMWYGTHPHSDHITVFSKALELHKSEFALERLAYNYQSYSNVEYDHRADWLREQTNKLFPDARYMKIRSGEEWTLADTKFQVLCTNEEVMDIRTGLLPATDANDCSSVLKVTMNGSTFLFVGDLDLLLQKVLLQRYTKTIRVDVLQGAHHMLNFDYLLYPAVHAKYILASQSKQRIMYHSPTYQLVRLTTKAENILFASDGTYGLHPQGNGKLNITFSELQCVPYDGSVFDYDF